MSSLRHCDAAHSIPFTVSTSNCCCHWVPIVGAFIVRNMRRFLSTNDMVNLHSFRFCRKFYMRWFLWSRCLSSRNTKCWLRNSFAGQLIFSILKPCTRRLCFKLFKREQVCFSFFHLRVFFCFVCFCSLLAAWLSCNQKSQSIKLI